MVKDSLKQISKGASIIFIGSIFASIIGLFNQIYMGRILGPENYGLFSLGLTIMTILCILPNFGLGQGLTQYIPYNMHKNHFSKIKMAIKFSLLFTTIIGIIVSLFLFLFSDIIALKIFNNIELGIVLKYFSIALTFWTLHLTLGLITQAFKAPKYYVYIENFLMPIIQLSIFILLSLMGFKLFGAIIGFVVSSIVGTLIYFYVMSFKFYKKLEKPEKKLNSNLNEIGQELIKFSFPLFLTGFTLLFMQYPDKLILGFFTCPLDVGLYSAAFTISTLILFIYTAFSFNCRPILSEYFANNNYLGIEKLYHVTTKWIFFITIPIAFFIAIYAKDIILIIYGSEFINAALPLSILVLGLSINCLTGISGELLISTKKTKLNLYSELIGAISNIIFNIALIPFFGIVGAALGTSIGIMFRNLSSFIFVYKTLKIYPYKSSFVKIILVSTIPFIISFPIKPYLEPFGFLKVIPFLILIYLGFLFITNSFDDFDKYILKSFLNKIFKINKKI